MADAPAAPAETTPAVPTETPAPATAPAADAPAQPQHFGIWDDDEPAADSPPVEEPAPEPPAAAPPVKAEPKPAEPAKEEPVAPKMAVLMKQEAEVRRAREEVKAREAALEAREAKMKAASEDPLSAIESLGLTYEQITEFVLNGKKQTPEMAQSSELKKVKADLERIQAAEAQREAERQRAAAAQAGETFKSAIKTFAEANQDNFECLNKTGRYDLVMDVVEAHWNNTGTILGGSQEEAIRQASEQVEKYLEDLAEPLLTTKKFQTKIQPTREVRPSAIPAQKQPARTLSNSQAAVVPPRAAIEFTNRDEVIERLAKEVRLFDDD